VCLQQQMASGGGVSVAVYTGQADGVVAEPAQGNLCYGLASRRLGREEATTVAPADPSAGFPAGAEYQDLHLQHCVTLIDVVSPGMAFAALRA
jgi:hypothetical protein